MNECDSWMVNRAHGKVLKYMIVALLLVKSSYISSPWFGSYTLNLPRYFKEITRMQDIESRPASSVGPLQSMVPGASHELLEQFPPYIYIYVYMQRLYCSFEIPRLWNGLKFSVCVLPRRCTAGFHEWWILIGSFQSWLVDH